MLARRGDSWPCRLTRQRVQVPAAVDAALRSNPTGPAPLPASMAAHQQAADAAQMQQAQQANQAHLALMGRIVLQLQASPQAGPFLEPVPRDIPGYYDMIRTPMDLGTVASKLQRGGYPKCSTCTRTSCSCSATATSTTAMGRRSSCARSTWSTRTGASARRRPSCAAPRGGFRGACMALTCMGTGDCGAGGASAAPVDTCGHQIVC